MVVMVADGDRSHRSQVIDAYVYHTHTLRNATDGAPISSHTGYSSDVSTIIAVAFVGGCCCCLLLLLVVVCLFL